MSRQPKGRENWKVAKSFRLDRELDRRLTDRAEAEGRSKSLVVSDALEGYLAGSVGGLPVQSAARFPKPAADALARVRQLRGGS